MATMYVHFNKTESKIEARLCSTNNSNSENWVS